MYRAAGLLTPDISRSARRYQRQALLSGAVAVLVGGGHAEELPQSALCD